MDGGCEYDNAESETEEGNADGSTYLTEENDKYVSNTSQKGSHLVYSNKGVQNYINVKAIYKYLHNNCTNQFIPSVTKESSHQPNGSLKMHHKHKTRETDELLVKSQPFLQKTVGLGMIVGRPMENRKYSFSSNVLHANVSSINENAMRICSDMNHHDNTSSDDAQHIYRTKVTEIL